MNLKPEIVDALLDLGVDVDDFVSDLSAVVGKALANQRPALDRICHAIIEQEDTPHED